MGKILDMVRGKIIMVGLACLYASSSPGQTTWQVPIQVQCNDWQNTLYLGVHPNGTDGYDVGLDTLSPPPGFGPYAYLYIPAFPNFLLADTRQMHETISYNLKTANCEGQQVRLSWDLTQFNSVIGQTGSLEIVGHVNMKVVDSLVVVGDLSFEIQFNLTTFVNGTSLGVSTPRDFTLMPFPNPSNSVTTFVLNLPTTDHVDMNIYNEKGQQLITLADCLFHPGSHRINWQGRDWRGRLVSSGIYVCRAIVGNVVVSKKFVLLR